MTYQRGKSRDYLARLQQQKQIAAAELAHEERELAAIRQAEQDIARLNEKRRQINTQIEQTTRKHHQPPPLPTPIHGGTQGLIEAAKEAAEWNRRRKERRAA